MIIKSGVRCQIKYNKEAVEAYIKNDIKKLEEFTAKKEPVIIILGYIQEGRFYNNACSLARVSYKQFNVWKQRKSAFSAAVELADAKAIDVAHKNVQDLTTTKVDWRGWAYLLGIKDERYKEKHEIELSGAPLVKLDITNERIRNKNPKRPNPSTPKPE